MFWKKKLGFQILTKTYSKNFSYCFCVVHYRKAKFHMGPVFRKNFVVVLNKEKLFFIFPYWNEKRWIQNI